MLGGAAREIDLRVGLDRVVESIVTAEGAGIITGEVAEGAGHVLFDQVDGHAPPGAGWRGGLRR